jgi:hypothetical protein
MALLRGSAQMAVGRLLLGPFKQEAVGQGVSVRGGPAMAYQSPPDSDLRILVRIISACTLGLWAFAAGLLIGTFLFS